MSLKNPNIETENHPQKIRFDICSICQLKCPLCSTGIGANKNSIIGSGYTRFIDFKELVDDNIFIECIELSNWGEIFLNPDFEEIIEYAHKNRIKLRAGNGVNLNTITENQIKALVKYKFSYLSVSIDGASNSTYSIYRKNGNFDQVINNIRKINHFKKEHSSEFPKLNWQFVAFGHNEKEILLAEKMSEELGMSFKVKLSWDKDYSPIKNSELLKKFVGASSRDEYKQQTGLNYKTPCLQLWNEPQINWNGNLLGCCVNRFGSFADVFKHGLRKSLKTEKFLYAQKMVQGKVVEKSDIPCYSCKVFKDMKSSNSFIKLTQ